MCGVPDFNALMLMGSRLIYFGGALISVALVYKYYPMIKKIQNRFFNTSKKGLKKPSIFSNTNDPGCRD